MRRLAQYAAAGRCEEPRRHAAGAGAGVAPLVIVLRITIALLFLILLAPLHGGEDGEQLVYAVVANDLLSCLGGLLNEPRQR